MDVTGLIGFGAVTPAAGGGNGLLTNLTSYWKLDEASGDAVDAHGSNTLTDTNTVGSGTGLVYGTVRDFERDNSEYFSITSNASLVVGSTSCSWAAWVKLESDASSATIFSKWDNSNGGYSLRWNSYTFLAEFNSTSGFGGYTTLATSADFVQATWYFVALTYENGVGLSLSVNAGTPVTTSYTGAVYDNSYAFEIGRQAGTGRYWDGLLGPAMFWKGRVLTSGDLTLLYNSGNGKLYSDFS